MVSDKKLDQQQRMVQSRKRAAAIDSYVDMIPARFYLGSESQVHNAKGPGLDPSAAQTTSQLIAKAATADGQKGADGGAGGSGKKNKKKNKKNGDAVKVARDQGELKQRLAERIAEMKESRRQKQSEADKAKNAAKKASSSGEADKPKAKEEKVKREKPSAGGGDEDDIAEAGRLTFNTKNASVPFEASVGRRGDKVKKLRAQLRKAEMHQEKIAKAEKQGEGEDARRSLELQKALKRARGEKVHDDTRKLRKAHKALATKKQKGKQSWEERVKNEREAEKEAQKKRKENIDAKRDKKRAKKFAHIKPITADD